MEVEAKPRRKPREHEEPAVKHNYGLPRFAQNITIEQAKAAVKDRAEFMVKEEEDYVVFNYKFCTSKTFPDPDTAPDIETAKIWLVRRECRGLMFSAATQRVVARRFHKFFNVGELPETQESFVDLTQYHVILEKFDGTLVSPVISKGKIRIATKSGITEVAKLVEDRVINNPIYSSHKYRPFFEKYLNEDWTPLFEYCSPRAKIVLYYEKDLLVLTAMRKNDTGEYMKYKDLVACAKEFNIPVTNVLESFTEDQDLKKSISEFGKIKEVQGIEGFVIKFEDTGAMYKMKTEWYFDRSKKEKQPFTLNSEQAVWKLILEQKIDDALVQMKDKLLEEKIKEFEVLLWSEIEKFTRKIVEKVKQKRKDFKKKQDFVNWAVKEDEGEWKGDKAVQGLMYRFWDLMDTGKEMDSIAEAIEVVVDFLKKNCAPKKLEINKKLLQVEFVENFYKESSEAVEGEAAEGGD